MEIGTNERDQPLRRWWLRSLHATELEELDVDLDLLDTGDETPEGDRVDDPVVNEPPD